MKPGSCGPATGWQQRDARETVSNFADVGERTTLAKPAIVDQIRRTRSSRAVKRRAQLPGKDINRHRTARPR
jgi:hypothetical protein